MADQDQAPSTASERVPGPELRLVDRRAFVGFPELKLAPGVTVTEFALQIPDITFPLNLSGGAAKYQKKKLDFGTLELSVDAEVIQREVRALAPKVSELDDVRLHFRAGHLEVQAWLRGPEKTPITFKAAFDGDGERLAVYLYDVRLYGFSPTPASRVGAVVSEAIRTSGVLPDVERRGVSGFTTRLLPAIVERAAVSRGYKMPSLEQARLADAVVSSRGLRLRFASGGLPPSGPPDEELLLALEGARAFADAEELLAEGKLLEARTAYLKLGDATEAHPFAVERLLTLLVADPQAHELVLDIAASLARRRDRSATALWAEAVVRERRGEFARASERYLALSALARRLQEEASAFFAAEAAARSSRDHAPQLAAKALHELLGLKPDHLPSLKALARASDQAKDRAGAIRAYRRLAALARDATEAAEAHVHLARLCAETEDDVAGARLHCEAALRLAPDHPEALLQLGQLCYRSGEWLRAIKALDRLREVSMARHEVDRVGRANLLAGLVWETGLKQPENALLRFREAASLLPQEPEPLYLAARVADGLGKVQEAVAGYQQAIELAGPAPRTPEMLKAAHASHHALARILGTRLGEPTRAREHLEAAVELDPKDTSALDELLPYYRATGKAEALAVACERAAAAIDDVPRRAALWAEAGELYRGRLNQADRAERLLSQALEADPKCRPAVEGLLALAESRRDGAQLCRCLKALALLTEDAKERARHYRRLAVAARDLAFDLELAAFAYREVLKVEPDDLPLLGELTALERRRADMPGLCWVLEQRARVAEQLQDKRLAAAALRELSQVLDTRLGRAGEALVALEKATRLFPEPNALLELASLSLRVERPLNARRALEDVLAMLPPHAAPERVAEVRARLGRACELLGDKDAARENYAVAFPLRRLDDELALRLEVLYTEGHHTQELIELWAARAQALLQAGRTQDAAPLFYKSALAAIEAKDAAGAMLRLNAALEAAPGGDHAADALEAMAHLELERGETAEAARLYARRASLDVGRTAARWYHAAAALLKDTPKEPGLVAKALEEDEGFVPARLRRGELALASNPREALADFEASLLAEWHDDAAVTPFTLDVATVTRQASEAAQRCGQYDAARRFLSRYTALRPGDVKAQLELAALLRRAGALEPLVDLLGELWPQLEGEEKLRARREYAEGALALGRSVAAVDALRAMLADAPLDEWAAARLLALLPADDAHLSERLELLSRLIATAQGEPKADLLAHRATLHRALGDATAARTDLLEAAELSPRPVGLLRALAEYAREARDEAGELQAWRLALAKAGHDVLVLEEAAGRLFALAQSRLDQGDAAGARDAYEGLASLELPPEERQAAWLGVARAALAGGDGARAEQALLEVSKRGPVPRRVDAHCQRATMLEARGATQAAAEAYGAALALSPRHPVAFSGVTRTLRTLEDWASLAEVLAAEAMQAPRGPEAAGLYRELASLYLERLGAVGPGEAALRHVVRLDEADVEARRRLAALLVEKGALPDAVALLEEAAARLTPIEAAAMLREAAGLARLAGDEAAELRLLRAAHQLMPATGEDLTRLAEALYLRGAVREALPLQQALAAAARFDEAPEEAERTHLRLAELALETGDRALAEGTLTQLVEARPGSTPAVERLAALKGELEPRAAVELLARHYEALGPSAAAATRLLGLARDSRRRPEELELTVRLYRLAATATDVPLPVRRELTQVLREAGRTAELMDELRRVAQLAVTQGEVALALEAWDEESRLAEAAGRVDDALRTLQAMAELAHDEGQPEEAAGYFLRRARLLRDAKLDLEGASQAMERAWELRPLVATADEGTALARRRADRDAELDWTERRLGLLEGKAQADAFVTLARLHLGLSAEGPGDAAELAGAPMLAPEQSEAALRRALEVWAHHEGAEALLLALLERLDRVGDVAAWYEEAAQRATDAKVRADLLLRAARLYQERAGRPHEAAAALLAARAADPDDVALTTRVADLLAELGRHVEAADFDALLLEKDAFHPSFARHAAWLEANGEALDLASLLSRRAQGQTDAEASATWLSAADAFLRAGAYERAQVCEDQAFEASAANTAAFERLRERAKDDPRRLAELLAHRAHAVPGEASTLLRERAELLQARGDGLLAAAAWDDYLALVGDDLQALAERANLAAQGGGPRASQPFDRRLVQLGGEALPLATRLSAWTRLGQAAMESQAFRDAVDAFEMVASLDADGARSRELLTTLSEAYARLGDADGQYRTTLKAAKASEGSEAEALYRRALTLHAEPEQAWEALDWLLGRHPTEESLYRAGLAALRRQGRLGEVVALHERYAAALGGPQAAEALTSAARVAREELADEARAYELMLEAARVDSGVGSATAALEEARRRRDGAQVEALLRALAGKADELEGSAYALELAAVLEARGAWAEARAALEPLRRRGPSGPGYAQALAALERVARAEDDVEAQVELGLALAELEPPEGRAARLLVVAHLRRGTGQLEAALDTIRQALAAHPTRDGLALAVVLGRALGKHDEVARALGALADLSEGEARASALLSAADAWEAAGEPALALSALERVAEAPHGLRSPDELATRFLELGAPRRAFELAFALAMDGGRPQRALELADAAHDEAGVARALEVLAVATPTSPEGTRYAGLLRQAKDVAGLLRYAEAIAPTAPNVALALWRELALEHGRADAAEALATASVHEVASLVAAESPEVLVVVARHLDALDPQAQAAVLARAARELPETRRDSLRALATLQRERGHATEAVAALVELRALEATAGGRAALWVEQGQLERQALGDEGAARASFEAALVEDEGQLEALRALVELYGAGPADRFAAVVERLGALAGDEAVASLRPSLADAYEGLGRLEEAYALLGHLGEEPALLRRRARLANTLGRRAEALELLERAAGSRAELEVVLGGYLDAQLVPFAVRVATRLLADGPLDARMLRQLGERLAATRQGAAVATRALLTLLGEEPRDADGWTLLAEALRQSGHEAEAELADGFGAALTNTPGAAPSAGLAPLEGVVPSSAPMPPDCVLLTDAAMPRLSASAASILEGLGARDVHVALDPAGGVEAFLSESRLVLGVGALSVFGPSELAFLFALALRLGPAGEDLRRPGAVEGVEGAVREAFRAVPASLAACRVVAQLDASARGLVDPRHVDVGRRLRESASFRTLAQTALDQLRHQSALRTDNGPAERP